MSHVVLGLDLSLSAAGMVAVPEDWGGDWSKVARATVGESVPRGSLEDRYVHRLVRLAQDVLAFAERNRCTVALCEGYAFGAKFERERLGELAGAVKVALASRGGLLVSELVTPQAGRKLMLGKNPASDPKRAVRAFLKERGLPIGWTDDEVDAFVIANVKLVELGSAAFRAPATVVTKKRRKAA